MEEFLDFVHCVVYVNYVVSHIFVDQILIVHNMKPKKMKKM